MSDTEIQELYAASYRRLLGQLIGVTGSVAEAEDVVQEAFVRGLDHPRKLLGADNPEAWLRTVAVNLARSRWRRAQRLVGLAPRLVEGLPAVTPMVTSSCSRRSQASGRPARGDRAAPPGRPDRAAGGRHPRPADRDGQGTAVPRSAALSTLLVTEGPHVWVHPPARGRRHPRRPFAVAGLRRAQATRHPPRPATRRQAAAVTAVVIAGSVVAVTGLDDDTYWPR